jgi:hypothetical protein
MIVRAGAHNQRLADCGGASCAPGGSLEFEMSKAPVQGKEDF